MKSKLPYVFVYLQKPTPKRGVSGVCKVWNLVDVSLLWWIP